MVVNQPHFLLFCDTNLSSTRACAVGDQGFGRWHFVLERLDGPERLEVADSEASVHRDRLALLAVVRGLEALEQPSQVTLVTTSRYVSRGLRYGLNEWREADYTWEHFGAQRPIRNADLWQRVDRALGFHQITCRLLQSQLAQAVVETATELDEISVLSSPLTPSLTPGNLCDSARCLSNVLDKEIALQPSSCREAKASRNDSEIPATMKPAAKKIQRLDAAHEPIADMPTAAPPKAPRSHRTSTCLQNNEFDESSLVQPMIVSDGFWRPKIRLTIPVFQFPKRWWQLAMAWVFWLRARASRSSNSPVMAPT